MKRLNYPVIVDITSCCQLPGAGGNYTKGKKDFINSTSHAVTALGIAGISVKVDDNPDELVSNFESTISLFEFSNLATEVINIDNIIKNNNE